MSPLFLRGGEGRAGCGEKGWVRLIVVEKEGTPLLHVIRRLRVE